MSCALCRMSTWVLWEIFKNLNEWMKKWKKRRINWLESLSRCLVVAGRSIDLPTVFLHRLTVPPPVTGRSERQSAGWEPGNETETDLVTSDDYNYRVYCLSQLVSYLPTLPRYSQFSEHYSLHILTTYNSYSDTFYVEIKKFNRIEEVTPLLPCQKKIQILFNDVKLVEKHIGIPGMDNGHRLVQWHWTP